MSQLITRMQAALAKSSVSVSLYDHSCGVLQIVDHMIRITPEYLTTQASILRLGAFLHDVGKLHPEFQQMLRNQRNLKKGIKHEAQTFFFYEEIVEEFVQITQWIEEYLQCDMVVPDDVADVLALAVTHHGLYYSALEEGVWQTRREWTRMGPNEERRITLADLLIRFHPLGGAIIFADMLHSEQLTTGRNNLEMIGNMSHLQEILEYIRERQHRLLQVEESDRDSRLPYDLLALLLT